MTRIKTTNVVLDKEVTTKERTVQCPWCNTYLKGISVYVIVMQCWYCHRDFKIQQDSIKWIDPDESNIARSISKYKPGD